MNFNFKVVVKRTMRRCQDVPSDFFFRFEFPITDEDSFREFCYFLLLSVQDGEMFDDISICEL